MSIPRPNRMGAINIEEKIGMRGAPAFGRYVGIDYSGAQTAETSLPGLRMYIADRTSPPRLPRRRLFRCQRASLRPRSSSAVLWPPSEIQPPVSPRKYWTRRGLAHRLAELLAEDIPTLVGIDHAFSFPLRYFEQHDLPLDWTAFLEDFQRHWPTDEEHLYVESVRDGSYGHGAARWGKSTWFFILTCTAQWPNQLIADCHGCAISAPTLALASTSGPSMAGRSRPAGRRWRKSIPPCGAKGSHARPATNTSTTPTPSRVGCAMRT